MTILMKRHWFRFKIQYKIFIMKHKIDYFNKAMKSKKFMLFKKDQ